MSANATQLATEVAFRIGQRLTIPQITPYLNRGISLIEGAGSYFWDLQQRTVTVTGNVPTLDLSTLSPLPEIGKAISFSNANGLPILKSDSDTAARASLNYKNVSATIFNTYVIQFGANSPGSILFSPPLAALPFQVFVTYHAGAVVLDAALPLVVTPWAEVWLDDLVIDYAEAEIKRILNWAEWDVLEKRFQAKLAEMRRTFTTQRESTGPLQEQTEAVAEEQSVGRS